MGWYKETWDKLPKWIRWPINRIDNIPDAIVEWLHCHRLPFGRQLNMAFIMKNRGKPYWPIFRKWGRYDNCDPEDLVSDEEQDTQVPK
jgi:hypothetical protein